MALNPVARDGNTNTETSNPGAVPDNGGLDALELNNGEYNVDAGPGGDGPDALERSNIDSVSGEVDDAQGRDFIHTNESDSQTGGAEDFRTVSEAHDASIPDNFNLGDASGHDGNIRSESTGGRAANGATDGDPATPASGNAGDQTATGIGNQDGSDDNVGIGGNGSIGEDDANGANRSDIELTNGSDSGLADGGENAASDAPAGYSGNIEQEEDSDTDTTDQDGGTGVNLPGGIEISVGEVTQLISVDLSAALLSVDISALANVVIQGLPPGVRLSLGNQNDNGDWELEAGLLGDLEIAAHMNLSDQLDLSVVGQTVNNVTGAITTVTTPVMVNVAAIVAANTGIVNEIVDTVPGVANALFLPTIDITDAVAGVFEGTDLSDATGFILEGLAPESVLNVGEPGAAGEWVVSLGEGIDGLASLGGIELTLSTDPQQPISVPDLSIKVESLNSVTGVLTEIDAPLPVADLVEALVESIPDDNSAPAASDIGDGDSTLIDVDADLDALSDGDGDDNSADGDATLVDVDADPNVLSDGNNDGDASGDAALVDVDADVNVLSGVDSDDGSLIDVDIELDVLSESLSEEDNDAEEALAQLFGMDDGGVDGGAVDDGGDNPDAEADFIGGGGEGGAPLIDDGLNMQPDNALSLTW